MKDLLKKIWARIKVIFAKVDEETKEHLPDVIYVVTNIKNFVDSPGCDFLTAVIPGTLDDTIQKLLKQYLPKLLDVLNKVESIAVIEDNNERAKAIVNSIRMSPDDARDILWHGIAGKLVQIVADIPWAESTDVANAVYKDPTIVL
jgi:hypothetical protein